MQVQRLMLTVCAAALFLCATSAAQANQIDAANVGGNLSGSSSGLTLSGSELDAIGPFKGNLGSVSLTTGSLMSGSLQQGGTFSGGSFVVTGDGADRLPNGTIFSGSFTGPVTWALVTLANGTHQYTLSGTFSGTWFTGAMVEGAVVMLTANSGKGFFNGSLGLASGNADFVGANLRLVTPEPTSMLLLGSGLVAVFWRKRKHV